MTSVQINKRQFNKLYKIACSKWEAILLDLCKGLLTEKEVSVNYERVREALVEADGSQRARIKEILDLTDYKELVEGSWYLLPSFNKFAFKFSGKYLYHGMPSSEMSFGLNYDGDWSKNLGVHERDTISGRHELMSHQQVEEMLTGIARKMYSVPQGIKYLDNTSKVDTLGGFKLSYDSSKDILYASGSSDIVYSNGEWAKAVPTIKLSTDEAQAKLTELTGNYTVID